MVVRGRVTAACHSCCGELVDVTFEDRIIVIHKQVAAAIVGVAEEV